MADNRRMLVELKRRLEGKTVIRVDPPGHPEAIGCFRLSDGTAFRLCATDLGFWTEDIPGEDGLHISLTTMLEEYWNYSYNLTPDYEPAVVTEGQNLIVIAEDGVRFPLPIYRLTAGERMLFLTSLDRLSYLATLGGGWRMGLTIEERALVE